jgi:simple sugar transport system ATP-binding protein
MDQTPAAAMTDAPPLLEARDISKYFGAVVALEGVSLMVRPGQVTCLLGDNGAGKSTLIKTLSGVHRPDKGTLAVDGQPVEFGSPADALDAGIATVYQDLSVMPLMSVTRNFFLGNEPTKGVGPLKRLRPAQGRRHRPEEMKRIGIDVRDTDQAVGTLSGGERQTLAIARAEYFGARVLILDEPTSALGVKQSAIVLRAHHRGPQSGSRRDLHHAQRVARLPIGDTFTILSRGRTGGQFDRGEVDETQLHSQMGGGDELHELTQELEALARADRRSPAPGNAAPTPAAASSGSAPPVPPDQPMSH